MNGNGPGMVAERTAADLERIQRQQIEKVQTQYYREVAKNERLHKAISDALSMIRAGHIKQAISDLQSGQRVR